MNEIAAIGAVSAAVAPTAAPPPSLTPDAMQVSLSPSGGTPVGVNGPQELQGPAFADVLSRSLKSVEAKVSEANALVREFAIDDSIPIHQVTIALEEARLSVEVAMQVRERLVDGYREIMNMQL